MHTQVGIIGAGPAGLLLARMLHLQGISSVVLESRSRPYVESRIRAGLLEQGSVDLLTETGMADRLYKEAMVHEGIELVFDGQRHRIDITALTGRKVYIYGQQEVVKDMIVANLAAGVPILFEAQASEISGLEGERATIRYTHEGKEEVPLCIHRAPLGTHERTIGFLIEHFAGKFPLWLAPVQVTVATVVADADSYAHEVVQALKAAGLRVTLDTENQTVNYKVRQHSLAKTPNLLVLGRREAENRTVTLRKLGVEKQESLALEAAISMLAAEAVPPDLR